jgi:hypothetical protein
MRLILFFCLFLLTPWLQPGGSDVLQFFSRFNGLSERSTPLKRQKAIRQAQAPG